MKNYIRGVALAIFIASVALSMIDVDGATLVGSWTFDEGEGITAGDEILGNDGTIYGATWILGRRGYALAFDGESTYVRIPNSSQFNMTNGLAVEAWMLMNPDQTYWQTDVFDKSHRGFDAPPYYSGFALQSSFFENKAMAFVVCNGSSAPEPHSLVALNDSTWHFITGTVSTPEGRVRFYLDGEMTMELPFEGPIVTNNDDVFVGRWWKGSRYFSGIIDEMKVYDGELSPEEIWQHYRAYFDSTSLVGYWAFDEGSGSLAGDSSSYANDGMIYKAEWTDGIRGQALSFDGESAHVQIPQGNQYDMTQEVSVAAWILMNPQQSNSQPEVFDKSHRGYDEPPYYSGFALQGSYFENHAMAFVVCNGSSAPEPHSVMPLNDSTWHYIVGTASTEDSLVRFYLDGDVTMELPFAGPIQLNEGDVFIGRWWGGNRYFSGLIDEVKIFNRSLTPEEIKEEYNRYTTKSEENPQSKDLPRHFLLRQNYPNPFNSTTTITFHVPEVSGIRISVFNVRGEKVAVLCDKLLLPGWHEMTWDACGLASGIYFAKLQASGFCQVKKMILLK